MTSLITQSFFYVIKDPFFWPSMAFTVMVGLFIGAVLYNGDIREVRKGVIALTSYVILLLVANLTRVIPEIHIAPLPYKPIAGAITTIVVTFFYMFGMWLGVRITKHAHNKI